MMLASNDIMRECGNTASDHFKFLDALTLSFGISLFQSLSIPKRIDFIANHLPQEPTCFEQNVFTKLIDGFPSLSDYCGAYRNLTVLLKRLLDKANQTTYSIEEHPHSWSFTYKDGIIKAERFRTLFHDMYKTRAAANMIVWTSNILGF